MFFSLIPDIILSYLLYLFNLVVSLIHKLYITLFVIDKMGKTAILLIIALLIVGGVGLYILNSSKGTGFTGSATFDNVNEKLNNQKTKTFIVTGENFKFVMDSVNNPDIKVKLGDKVRIEFTSTGGFHDWKVDEFYAATKQVVEGDSTFVEFTADKKGSFEYYCSVGQHRANGMKGKLIVE